jgi:hypothetical protein
MRYFTGKNTPRDTHNLSSYTVNNESHFVSVKLFSSLVQNGEISNSILDLTIRNSNFQILDPDFVKPEGFIESDPNTWGASSLPKIIDESKQYWDYFKSKEPNGSEKAIFETLIEMGELPKNGTYK